jgi:hypothetical protein
VKPHNVRGSELSWNIVSAQEVLVDIGCCYLLKKYVYMCIAAEKVFLDTLPPMAQGNNCIIIIIIIIVILVRLGFELRALYLQSRGSIA